MKNNLRGLFSTSIAKNAFSISTVILGFYILFNLFAISKLSDLADEELDKKLSHELNHIDQFVDLIADTLFFHSFKEFEEEDFQTITENPYFLQIYNYEDSILFNSPNLATIGLFPHNIKLPEENYSFENIEFRNIDYRSSYKKMDGEDHVLIQLITTRQNVSNLVEEFELFNLITFPIIIVLTILISFYLSNKTYSRLNMIINLANDISAQNLSKRLDYEATPNDVYENLKDTLNDLFDRLENQINQISEFSNNASHQLMTPLTTLKSELEFILKRERSSEEYIETLLILKKQTDKMIGIVHSLLMLARESDKTTQLNKVFSMNKVIGEEIKVRYAENNIEYKIKDGLLIRGNAELFSILIQNMIDNSIKYCSDKPEIVVEAFDDEEFVILNISDNGIGISSEKKIKIFDKFYRDPKNEGLIDGSGLGLNIVLTIAKQMQASVEVKDNRPQGTVFSISFPKLEIGDV